MRLEKSSGEATGSGYGHLIWCAVMSVLLISVGTEVGAGQSSATTRSSQDTLAKSTTNDTSKVPGGGTDEGVANHVVPGPAGLASQLDSIRVELARLWDDVERLRAVGPRSVPTDRDWASLVTELEMVKAELAERRDADRTHRPLMASLDNEGFLLPEETATRAQVTDLENQVKALDTQVKEALKRPAEPTVNSPRVQHGRIEFDGFVHGQYADGFDQESSFDTKRARLGVKGEVNPYTQIKIVGEFAGSTKLLDGVLTYSPQGDWSFSAGQYKTPFGSDFLTSATAMPFVTGSMAAGLGPNRDVGISLAHRRKLGGGVQIKSTAGLFNGSGINKSDGNSRKNFVLRSEISLPAGFTIAPNVLFGKTNDIGAAMQDLRNYGGSLRWQDSRFTAMGELVYREIENEAATGWYVWGGPRLNTGWNMVPTLELLARYEQFDDTHGQSDDTRSLLTLGANLFVDGKYTLLQVNYQIEGEDAPVTEQDRVLVNFQVAF